MNNRLPVGAETRNPADVATGGVWLAVIRPESAAVALQPAAGLLQVAPETADTFTTGDKQGRDQDQDQDGADHGFSSLSETINIGAA